MDNHLTCKCGSTLFSSASEWAPVGDSFERDVKYVLACIACGRIAEFNDELKTWTFFKWNYAKKEWNVERE
jgi:hypothetical protein